MASSIELKIFQRIYRIGTHIRAFSTSCTKNCSHGSENEGSPPHDPPRSSGASPGSIPPIDQDPLPIFLQHKVQELLLKISGFDMDKIVSKKHKTASSRKPHYELMTEPELKTAQAKGIEKAIRSLKMPPFMSPRKPIEQILSKDPMIAEILDSKYVFTDISYGLQDRERTTVVRDPDGTLRMADPEEKSRANLIYNPRQGVSFVIPKMFEDNQLKILLSEGSTDISYILDRACVQFEPDDPNFIRVTQNVYDHVLEQNCYDKVRSTRFFGPMAFYFVLQRNIAGLLVDMIHKDLLLDAVCLVHLYEFIHKKKSIPQPQDISEDTTDHLNIIQRFCETNHKEEKLESVESAVRDFRRLLRQNVQDCV